MEDSNLVLAVTGGGEMDDRVERLVIEDDMDRLRAGGYSTSRVNDGTEASVN